MRISFVLLILIFKPILSVSSFNRCSLVLISLNVCANRHISSAYSRSSSLSVRVHLIPLGVSVALASAVTRIILKRSGDSTQLCLTPLPTGTFSLFLFLWITSIMPL